MKGLELSRLYYGEVFLPALREKLPSAEGHFAAGLVGEGSECFGFDDKWSQDHAFGVRLCIWMPREEGARFGADLQSLWKALPDSFRGYRRPVFTAREGRRDGIFTVDEFYQQLIGFPDAPETTAGWLAVREPALAAATNGEVYIDGAGVFSAVRRRLLSYYPEDLVRYFLAQHAAAAAQTGQYNLLRASLHGEPLAAENIRAAFSQHVIAMVFLLNKSYRPFYKWAPRAMRALPVLGGSIHEKLLNLYACGDLRTELSWVEEICADLLDEMRRQGYTSGESSYLMDHLPEILDGIRSPELKRRGIDLVF